jgi:DNA invertase Pin-like site-specific DNA recombinase
MFQTKKTFIYARESSSGSKAKEALKSQVFGIQMYAHDCGINIVDIVSEQVSAKNFLHQKKLQKFIKENPNSHLIVNSVDRFGRSYSQIDLMQKKLTQSNISVTFIRENIKLDFNDIENPYACLEQFYRHMKIADTERKLIAERFSRGKMLKKKMISIKIFAHQNVKKHKLNCEDTLVFVTNQVKKMRM